MEPPHQALSGLLEIPERPFSMVINHVLGALIVTTEPETLISWHQADAVIFQEEKEFNYSPSARDP